MICFPHAKINLGLNVVEKRSDGYHNIQSIFYPVGLCDALEVIGHENGEIEFNLSGNNIPGNKEDNLCLRAYRLLKQEHELPGIKAHLHKVIPTGAGLGGGSADGTFFLKLVNEKFGLHLSWGELHHYARQLGSDCSFFVSGRPSFVQGRGDEYEGLALDLSSYFIALVHPGIHVSTQEAYAGVMPAKPARDLEKDILTLPVEQWKDKVKNDFEESVFKKYPAVKIIREKLYSLGALYASMSGSGSAVYGIFKTETDLKKEFPGCFVWEGRL